MSNDSEVENADEETVADPANEPVTDEHVEHAADEHDGNGGEAEAEPAGLQEEAFVELDYTARTVEDGDLVDTTDPEVAEEEGVDDEREFGPRTVVLGEGHIFPSVEDDVVGRELGETGSVVVPAGEAFGEYDEEEVRTVSKDKLPEDERYPGAQVQVDGEQGFVETIIGGRARVDFNHPLAGEDIEYEYEVVGEITDREERAESFLETLLDLQLDVHFDTDTVEEEQVVEDETDEAEGEGDSDGGEEAEGEEDRDADTDEGEEAEGEEADEGPVTETVEVEKESLYIEATPELTMNQQWMFQKQSIAQDLIDLLDVDRVVIQEIIEGSPGMGMPGMMGGMGGGGADIEAALEEADLDDDIDADELVEELDEA